MGSKFWGIQFHTDSFITLCSGKLDAGDTWDFISNHDVNAIFLTEEKFQGALAGV